MKYLLACICALSLLLASGCGTLDKSGVYAGNTTLYQADVAIGTTYDVVDTFLKWESANRGTPACPASVTAAADDIRTNAPAIFKSAIVARDAYASSANADNLTKLQAALGAVQAILNEANTFLAKSAAPSK